MAKSNSYWKGRFEKLEDEQYQKSAAYYKDVQEQFRRASNSIQLDTELWYRRLADNNGVSYGNAKRFLKESELEEFQWTVEQYINAGEEHGVDRRWMKELENASARHHISYLEAMNMQVQQHAELLSTEFEGGMTDFLHKSYGDQYYRSAFEAAKGTGVGSNLARLDSRKVDVLIRKPWAQDGANFSDRIWSNKQKLVNNLHTELAQNIIRGASPQNAIAGLAKIMEVSRSQAGRLIMTESAAISSAAQKDCFKALGVEKYEILATLDSLTSKICQELDGKVFDMKDYEVGTTAPPFHPNCRSTTVPHFDDEFTEGEMRAARDGTTGKTVYMDGKLNYKEWEKEFVSDTLDDSLADKVKKGTKGVLTGEKILNYNELPEKVRGSFEEGLKHADTRVGALLQHEMADTQYYITESKNSEYTELVNVIGINPQKGSGSVAHEMFHRIDDKYKVTKNSNMLNSFYADLKSNEELYANPSTFLQKEYPAMFENSVLGKQKILKKEYEGISDIFSALSDGTIKLGYGHSEKYWTEKPERRLKEIWAQYGRTYYENNAEVKAVLNNLFPTGSERVNMKLKGLVDDVER